MKTKMDDIPVLDEIVLPFRSEKSFFSCPMLRATGDKILKRNNLRTDKSPLHVAVDLPSRFRRWRSLWNGPGPQFQTDRCIESDECKNLITHLNQSLHAPTPHTPHPLKIHPPPLLHFCLHSPRL